MLNKVASRELEQLARANGGLLDPERVVTRAKDPNSALHQFFEWDAKSAQKKLHVLVARQLIRAYEVYVEMKDTGTKEKVRAFVSLTTDRKKGTGGGYRLLADVVSHEERREQLLADALKELESFQRKYRQLNQLGPVFEAIEKVQRAAVARAPVESRASA